ncbi:MAG: ATP phosphoribosyltransferase, partial [Sphingobacteriia bacterium]|nr:ATP phosphoribosyltransferase [Sphingobacteriia bacterium]
MLSIAVPKGRVLEEVNQLLLKSGLITEEINEDRKLILEYPENNMKFILS